MQRDLVILSQRGDVDAFSRLTAGRTTTLYAVARLILRDDERAAETVQDALLQAWLDIGSLRDPDRFDAWIHRLLVRACYRAARGHRRRDLVEIAMPVITEPMTPDSQRSLERRDQLARGFARLSTDHRTVIVLVHYLGLTLAEAAAAMGVPLGTVQSRLSRATQSMRAALEADDRMSELSAEAIP